jgi:hypothetical protein
VVSYQPATVRSKVGGVVSDLPATVISNGVGPGISVTESPN